MSNIRIIFDGNNTAYRSDCMTELYTKQGVRTSAIVGVLNSTHSVVEKLPEYYGDSPISEVVYAWDTGHAQRRKDIFPEYKANRRKDQTDDDKERLSEFIEQCNVLHENLPLFGIKSYRKKGWEGDDILYALSEELHSLHPDDKIVLVSTDEDFHQLVSDYLDIYSPIKQVLYTKKNYKELTGIDQELFLTYKILKGDSSDGIPGIQGIGEKTGKDLVNKYGKLDSLLSLESKSELMKSKRTAKIFTQEGLDILLRNNQLINLKDFVDYSEIQNEIDDVLGEAISIDNKASKQFLMKYQVTSILMKYKRWIETFEEVVGNF